MAKRKTLPKDFEDHINDDEALKKMYEKCEINAYFGYDRNTALFYPVSENMVKWLIENGADINFVNRSGETPLLHLSMILSCEENALLLIKYGADVNFKDAIFHRTALFRAAEKGMIKLYDALVNAGADSEERDFGGNSPLEAAFGTASTFDLIRLEPITRHLIENGTAVTDDMKKSFLRVAEDIEFRRKSFNQDSVPELDKALESLYSLLDVEPVPKRAEYDEKTPITVKSRKWQEQQNELWNLLVPGSGHAGTVQGEVIRITGILTHEILDNGCCNWDRDFNAIAKALKGYLGGGNRLSDSEYDEINALCSDMRNKGKEELYRLAELSVKWVLNNPQPVKADKIAYKR